MHFLFLPYGTAGDVYPHLGIGIELKNRGHRVTVITHSHFRGLVLRLGLEHSDLDDLEPHRATIFSPDYWVPFRGITLGAKLLLFDGMRKQYAAVERLYVPGDTVAVVTSMSYGAMIFAEKFDLPLVHTHVSPFLIPSVSRPTAQPIFDWVRRISVFRFMRLIESQIIERFFLDRWMPGPEINRFRAELGIAPVRHCLRHWLASQKNVLGLFPRAYALNPTRFDRSRAVGARGLDLPLPSHDHALIRIGPKYARTSNPESHGHQSDEAAILRL